MTASENVAAPMEDLEQILKRRHQLELTLFRRLSATCRNHLTTRIIANPDCRSCRNMIDHAFSDHTQPDDEAVENAYYHLANRDGCDGARELRCAEAERMLSRAEPDEARGAPTHSPAASTPGSSLS